MAFFGVPEKIICDQGVEFSSNLFKDLCKQHELEHDNRDIEANKWNKENKQTRNQT